MKGLRECFPLGIVKLSNSSSAGLLYKAARASSNHLHHGCNERGSGHPMRPRGRWYSAGGAGLACILLIGIPARWRGWQTTLGMLAFLVALSGGVAGSGGGGGEGGGTSNPGAPAGNYTVTLP